MDGMLYFDELRGDELRGGVTISKSKFIDEHNKLLHILKKGTKQERLKEAKDQAEELATVMKGSAQQAKKEKLLSITKSDKPDKKLMAQFLQQDGRTKTIYFGAAGMDDFTKSNDKEKKKRYLTRHSKNESWSDPMTAGALSRWILWNKPTLEASIRDFCRRFDL